MLALVSSIRVHESDPRRPTRERVKELLVEGLTPIEIARQLEITKQRVYQHLRAIREEAA